MGKKDGTRSCTALHCTALYFTALLPLWQLVQGTRCHPRPTVLQVPHRCGQSTGTSNTPKRVGHWNPKLNTKKMSRWGRVDWQMTLDSRNNITVPWSLCILYSRLLCLARLLAALCASELFQPLLSGWPQTALDCPAAPHTPPWQAF